MDQDSIAFVQTCFVLRFQVHQVASELTFLLSPSGRVLYNTCTHHGRCCLPVLTSPAKLAARKQETSSDNCFREKVRQSAHTQGKGEQRRIFLHRKDVDA